MPFTFGNLKSELRLIIFPSGEAQNLIAAHNKFFLDAIIDAQTWVDCLQYDNTSLYPQCSTYYNCGITVIPAPRGSILKVSVIDKINPTTHKEDATAADDWCSEITYRQIDFCHIKQFLGQSGRSGCCNIPLFFGLSCNKGRFPRPTDAGLTGLATLPLGFHYGQTSTDDKHGRAQSGVWAMDRGKIYLAPWIQSTETVVVKWDGTKRTWSDDDPIDDDPLLKLAFEEYVRWQHAAKYDHDYEEAGRANGAYDVAIQNLIHACREETRVRGCERSNARQSGTQSGTSTTPLFFNDKQQATANCPDGQTGTAVTITIAAGTVASNISVNDANQKALNEAQQQATAQLDCQTNTPTFTNDAQSFTAQCQSGETGAPAPDGNPITITIPAGKVTSTLSKADANEQAFSMATQQATAQLNCTYWNAVQTYVASCPTGQSGTPVSKTVSAHTVSSTISQDDADAKANNLAKTQAENELICNGQSGVFTSTIQIATSVRHCQTIFPIGPCLVTVKVTAPPGSFTSLISLADANNQAISAANNQAQLKSSQFCALHQCGTFNFIL